MAHHGIWEVVYTEQAGGTYGPLHPETLPAGGTAGLPGCNGTVVDSADKCQANFDYTCPFKGIGTIRFVGAGGQTSETTISASETIYIVTNVGTCTSTYSVAITRI